MISVAAYLENEKVADLKSEYVHGRCRPVMGSGPVHDRVCVRLTRLLHAYLEGTPCRVFRPTVKAHIRSRGDERFYYPDIQVVCDEPCGLPDYLDNPCLILEVLCESNGRLVREEKGPAYRGIDSLEELALVDCSPRRVQLWRRRGPAWALEEVGGDETLRLDSIGLDLSFSNLVAVPLPVDNPTPAGDA